MQTLTENEIKSAILAEKTFEARLEGGSFIIKIKEYLPYLCTAIHAGHQLRSDLHRKIMLNNHERMLEEDHYTDVLIESFPITLIAKDSRYEYDLNRSPDACIYDEAWGRTIWKTPLTKKQRKCSLEKHACYYRILKTLCEVLEKKFGACMLIDMHSYNWQTREYEQAPVFNLGTSQINKQRWHHVLSVFENKLANIELTNIKTVVKRDVVYQGRGYQATFIVQNFSNCLIIPFEIKKIFMDEKSGEFFPLVMEKLQEGIYLAVLETVTAFNKNISRSKLKKKTLPSSTAEAVVFNVDKALYYMAKNIETLSYVNPVNILQEKRRFLSHRHYNPQFRYRQLPIDPYEFKEKAYNLPVSQIQDPLLRGLYRAVVNSLVTKIELLAHLGTPQFLYTSLRYYGEPSPIDIDNAYFLLHAGEVPGYQEAFQNVSAENAKIVFERIAKEYGLSCRIVVTTRIVAKAMVDNSRRTLFINRDAKLTQAELEAFIHHELGVHMVTTINALEQPLQVFKLGLPGNTYTQEGLAILSEYLSGNLNMQRLKQLALRVLVVDMMVKGINFNTAYNRLREEYQLSVDSAFTTTTRVYRGGGLTKDYLYLSGFRDMLELHKKQDLSALLIGKTGFQFLGTLDALIEQGIIFPPRHLTPALAARPQLSNPVLDYIVSSIR